MELGILIVFLEGIFEAGIYCHSHLYIIGKKNDRFTTQTYWRLLYVGL